MSHDVVLWLLVQLAVIVAVSAFFGKLARFCKQPMAVGWIAAGVFLGPTVLGRYLPGLSHWIFHPAGVEDILPKIFSALAEIGLVLLLFITGVEFDFSHLKKHGSSAMLISLAGISVPMLLGFAISPFIFSVIAPPGSTFGSSLFLALCLSITALPILGHIMMELHISRTKMGAIIIAAGATDDAVGWILLATVAALVRSGFDPGIAKWMLGYTLLFGAVMYVVVRPLLTPWLVRSLQRHKGKLSRDALVVLVLVVLFSAIITHMIGIFALFGAFMAGAVFSGVPGLREAVKSRLEDVVTVLFLPIFFTHTGLHTDITGFSPEYWVVFAVIFLAACVGKLVGCGLAARLSGFSWRESGCMGVMMNCRALMELIALNVGFQLGVVPPEIYSMLVIVALVTTAMTVPLLLKLRGGTELEEPIARSGFLKQGLVTHQPLPVLGEKVVL